MTAMPADNAMPALRGGHAAPAPRTVPPASLIALPGPGPSSAWHAQFVWHCPRCRQPLATGTEGLACTGCDAGYACIGGIPDLRLPGPSWIDHEADRNTARRLLAETAHMDIEAAVRRILAAQPGRDAIGIARRTREVMQGPASRRADVRGWLHPCLAGHGPFLDLGCGGGALLAAAAAEGRHGIGIDVSMTWLVVAARLIEAHGGRPVLAAAMAEALPLADGAVGGVVSLDVIEHVADPLPYLKEIDRVTCAGGHVALATPNRFSLTAEPHVFVWGVGWLPRPLQARYVHWRSGKPYAFTRLLSTWETARLVRRATRFDARILIPPVAEEEIAHFPPRRAQLARLYNRLLRWAGLRSVFRAIGPFFRVVGVRRPPSPA